MGNLAHEAVVHAELVLRNPEGELKLFSSTMRAGARWSFPHVSAEFINQTLTSRLENFQKYMDRFAHPPAGKPPAYYVVLRPKSLTPRQIDIMYSVVLLMLEQNQMYTNIVARPTLFSSARQI